MLLCISTSVRQAAILCQTMRQVLRLSPEDDKRLITLFRERILPVAQKALRLWKKGEARLPEPEPSRCFAQNFAPKIALPQCR